MARRARVARGKGGHLSRLHMQGICRLAPLSGSRGPSANPRLPVLLHMQRICSKPLRAPRRRAALGTGRPVVVSLFPDFSATLSSNYLN